MKKSLFCAAILIAMGLIFTSAGFGQGRVLGGYKVIETTDAGAVNAAKFAIKAQSEKDEMEYELGDIVKAERQAVAGSNYRLCMDVSANGGDGSYVQAVVNVDLKNNFKVLSWASSDCGGPSETGSAPKTASGSAYKVIVKTDPGAGLAADVAVKTQAEKTKTKLKFDEIVKAETQELKGMSMNYRLCIKVSDGAKSSFGKALVSVDQYSNYKLISWADSNCGAH